MVTDKVVNRQLAIKLLDDMPKSIRDFFNYSTIGWHSSAIISAAKLYARGISEQELLHRLKEEENYTRLKLFLK